MTDTCHVTRVGKTADLPTRKIARYGWRPDTPDHRDLSFRPMVTKVAPAVDLRTSGFMPSVYDQGDLGSCTANAIGSAYEYLQKRSGYTDYMPSRLFIYYGERVIEHSVGEDAGAEIRDGMKVIGRLGTPHEQLWAYDVTKFAVKPSPAAYQDGLMHQCIKYQRVQQGVTSLKLALSQGLPVVFGFTVGASFESDEVAHTGVWNPVHGEEQIGGHAVKLVGYKSINTVDYFIVKNSWGTGWGDGGYFYMPTAWVASARNASDFWVIQQVEAGAALSE